MRVGRERFTEALECTAAFGQRNHVKRVRSHCSVLAKVGSIRPADRRKANVPGFSMQASKAETGVIRRSHRHLARAIRPAKSLCRSASDRLADRTVNRPDVLTGQGLLRPKPTFGAYATESRRSRAYVWTNTQQGSAL